MKKIFILISALIVFISVTSSGANNSIKADINPNFLTEKELLKDYLSEQPKFELIANDISYLEEKVVIVFGGGGSIGAELVRQLADKKLKQLIVVDNHENSLANIKKQMKNKMPKTELVCCLGDIRDRKKLESILDTYNPNIIFHYANYKSVDMSFISPKEFFNVNVIGTINLLEVACNHSGVERFVYISSIRAQNPTEPYGRTKRIDELLVKKFADTYTKIKFGSLRYCNVMDSAGSYAIPVFREQILNGEPIKIKKIGNGELYERYFISLDTAANLAIKVGSECNHGEIFSLDTSKVKSIKIDELVRLIAKEYGVEHINIQFEIDPNGKNIKMPSSKNGDGNALDALMMKISIDSNSKALNEFFKKILNLNELSSDKETDVFLSDLLDDAGDLPRVNGPEFN